MIDRSEQPHLRDYRGKFENFADHSVSQRFYYLLYAVKWLQIDSGKSKMQNV